MPTIAVLLAAHEQARFDELRSVGEEHGLTLERFDDEEQLRKVAADDALAVVLVDCSYCTEELRKSLLLQEPRPTVVAVIDEGSALQAASSGADHMVDRKSSPIIWVGALRNAVSAYEGRLSQLAYKRALELAPNTVEITDPDARLEYVNPEFLAVNRYELSEVLGKTPAQLLRSGMHNEAFYESIWKTVTSGENWSGAMVGGRSDGSSYYEIATISPVKDRSGAIRKIVAVKHPVPGIAEAPLIGEFDEAESRAIRVALSGLAASESQYRSMVEAAGDAIGILDFESARFVDVNHAACELFGYTPDEFRAMVGRQMCPPEAEEQVEFVSRRLINEGRALEPRLRMIKKDGTRFWATVRMTTYMVNERKMYCAIIRDATKEVDREEELEQTNTELAQAQGRLLQNARLAALGQLAAGVAHEVNNPLQFIQTSLADLEDAVVDANPEIRQLMDDVSLGVGRIQSVVGELLPFARVGMSETTEVDVNAVISASVKMLANQVRHRAKLTLELDPKLPLLIGYRDKLGQVFTNLVLNAAQAITEGAVAENEIHISSRFNEGNIVVVVRDTGAGIDQGVMSQLFEPFFTTRPDQHGTGLGLALSKDISRIHGGGIHVTSELGQGSSFTVTLPIENGLELTRPVSSARIPIHGARVLVIDDEALVLKSYKRVLGPHYDVTTALGGEEALEILRQDLSFDAILCDLMMPNVDGIVIYEHIENFAPHLLPQLVFCTGGVFSDRVREFIEMSPGRLLYKPVAPELLKETITAVARQGGPSSLPGPA